MPRKALSHMRVLPELLTEAKRWNVLLEATGLPRATLTNSLKRLRKMGLVEPVLVNDEVHWELTPQGIAVALEETGRKTESIHMKKALFSVTIEELYPDAWSDLITEVARINKMESFRPKDVSGEDFKRNVKSYSDQIKTVVAGLWPSLVHDFVHMTAYLLANLIVIRAFLPSPLDEKSRMVLSRFMANVSKPASADIERQIRELLLGTFNYLEALVVLAKAAEEGKVSAEEWMHKPANEVIRMLQQKGLLEVIQEPGGTQIEETS